MPRNWGAGRKEMEETYRAVNFTTSWFADGSSEVGSHCCGEHHDTLEEAIICFEEQGEAAFGNGLHGGGHEFRAYDEEKRYRTISEDSQEWKNAVEFAENLTTA